jgi:hypothetical protein
MPEIPDLNIFRKNLAKKLYRFCKTLTILNNFT